MIFANVFLSSSEAEAEARRGPHTNKNVSNFHGLIHCRKTEHRLPELIQPQPVRFAANCYGCLTEACLEKNVANIY